MSAEAIHVRSRLIGQYKDRLVDNAAVVIAALAVLIASGALMFSGIAMYAAVDAKEETEVYEIYVNNLHADLKAHGFELPPLPGERK